MLKRGKIAKKKEMKNKILKIKICFKKRKIFLKRNFILN